MTNSLKSGMTLALILSISAVTAPAWAINKCAIDGRVVFQDAPCPGKGEALTVRPASGAGSSAEARSQTGQTPQKAMTEAQRIEASVKSSQDARRKAELESRIVPDAEGEIERHRSQCDREYHALQDRKRLANNNLAGATWEGSISSEMTALATRCDTRNRDLRAEADKLRAECQRLGGCK